MNSNSVKFRFYEELNDFLPKGKQKKDFSYTFIGKQSIKDAIEALGVPHTEVDLILVNGKAKKFSYQIKEGDRISVYPMFESLNIGKVTHLRKKPLRRPTFILDVHLGKLAHYLRLLGFDTQYQNNYTDKEIVHIASTTSRTVLTRDVGLLKNKKITRGYWLRNTNSWQQINEVLKRFDLQNFKPFSRCLECNGNLQQIKKKNISEKLPLKTKIYYDKFYRCRQCKKIYWEGSHYQKLRQIVKVLSEL